MNHVSLFTGIGGLDLAAEAAGFETVLQVEQNPYALRVLEKHWSDVPRITDVREVNNDERWTNPTVVSGGFPCQPFSTAARGRNNATDLWPYMRAVCNKLGSRWVVAENVARKPIARAAYQLEADGWRATILRVSSSTVGAPQNRVRWFLVANSDSNSQSLSTFNAKVAELYAVSGMDEWPEPPGRVGMVNGISHKMDRLKALGNAVVPQQAYPIFATIAKMEEATP